ncbi:glycosyltransferase family 2 protein [Poseidonocella sp. HB161398]|uniref:glycosyltransferase family 2 protein n=1 Tax=Poseidonocella sp. HB161398 TaxID=2320855 RepID=UPI001107E185|nr:glycosyltransferase family 2 protein [Poseidonocella sp. HB161398]
MIPGTDITLGVVAISRNEEANLPGLFANAADWADEIVIIDSGSTDRSREIAEAAGPGVRFIERPMSETEGFAGQRNAGIDAASADWLLHVDCDERLSPELLAEIFATLPGTAMNGFRYRRLNHFLHRPMRHGGWDSWNRPQLARRGHHRFTGRIHEACEIEGGAAKTGQLEGMMIHLNEESFAERLAKSAGYTAMTADGIEDAGTEVSGSQILFRTAREFLKRYLLQRGFLDGTPGLISALHSATAEFRARALVWDRQNAISRDLFEAELARAWHKDGKDPL